MPQRPPGNIIVLLLCTVLTIAGCTKHERNEELAARLADEIVDEGGS